jgi:phosphotransferase system enzyme I (PtsP)
MLAVDRNNPRVSRLFSNVHPAVLRALMQLVQDVHAEHKPISICGEMAGNPGAAILLMAMGFDTLSMNATNLLKVKSVIRNMTLVDAKELLKSVLKEESTEAVKARIDYVLRNAGVERLLRASRTS